MIIAMGIIILLAFLGLALGAAILAMFLCKGKTYHGTSYRLISGVTAAMAGVALVAVYIFTSLTSVQARTVGIVTSFGKPVGTLSPGIHWTAPWESVTEFPTSNQVLDLDATNEGPNVAVKFAGGGSGWANVNITWQVESDERAVSLWENWREFDAVKENVVNPRGQSAVVEVFGAYTPEDAVNGTNLQDLNRRIKETLQDKLTTSGIHVVSVDVKRVDLSQEIQERVNRQVQARADVNRAKIEQERAEIEEHTNRIRQQSLTPEALARYCMDVANNWNGAKNGQLPANWNCMGGSSLPLVTGTK
ncbi:hypothetical protein BAY59_10875 [Prauserella coralliicola]|nr:hypothetical protein BAY59_10875 [Prauserella coralliicola]